MTIKDSADFDFSELDGRAALETLGLENVSNLQRLDQLPHLPNLKTLG